MDDDVLQHAIVMDNGDHASMYSIRGSDGFICHICGTRFPDCNWKDIAWYMNSLGRAEASFEGCPECGTTFGYEDAVVAGAPPGSTHQRWMRERLKWLDKRGWDEEAVEQLGRNLGITRDELLAAKAARD